MSKSGKKRKSVGRLGERSFLLSACMMVRDEQKNLPRCLNSIKDFVDEITVVDTGSIDKTVEIAESFGAKVYHRSWENDFSKHRNHSIDCSSGDWNFIIDADEELIFVQDPFVARREFDKCIKKHKFPAAAIGVKDIQKDTVSMQFSSARFFKKGAVKYNGIVHNQPTIDGQALFLPFLSMKHYGYDMTPELQQRKFTRTASLLNRRLEEDPKDYSCYFYLSQIYGNVGDVRKCIEYGEKYLGYSEELEWTGNFNRSIYFTIIHNYMKEGNSAGAKKWLDAGRKKISKDLDLMLAETEYGVWMNNNDQIVSGAKEFVAAYTDFQRDPSLRDNRFVYSAKPEALAYCVYYLSVVQLKEGVRSLQLLRNILKEVPQEFREILMKELEKELKSANLPIHLQGMQSGTAKVPSSAKSPVTAADPTTSIFEASIKTIMQGDTT